MTSLVNSGKKRIRRTIAKGAGLPLVLLVLMVIFGVAFGFSFFSQKEAEPASRLLEDSHFLSSKNLKLKPKEPEVIPVDKDDNKKEPGERNNVDISGLWMWASQEGAKSFEPNILHLEEKGALIEGYLLYANENTFRARNREQSTDEREVSYLPVRGSKYQEDNNVVVDLEFWLDSQSTVVNTKAILLEEGDILSVKRDTSLGINKSPEQQTFGHWMAVRSKNRTRK